MKKDIENRDDIKLLVTTFYDKVKADRVIGFIFNDVMKTNWEQHMPVMYDFWENTIFYTGNYTGNPLETHKHLHRIIPLTPAYFDRWLGFFSSTVDELYAGPKATLAKQRAFSIATVMKIKILEDTPDSKSIL